MYTQPPALVSLYVCSSNHRSIVESVFIDSYTVESYVLFLSQKFILSVNLPQGKLYGLLFVERLWVSLRSFCSFNVNVKQKTMFNCMDKVNTNQLVFLLNFWTTQREECSCQKLFKSTLCYYCYYFYIFRHQKFYNHREPGKLTSSSIIFEWTKFSAFLIINSNVFFL